MQNSLFSGAIMSEQGSASYLQDLDEQQRRAVLARESCVVTAGAGAGKTTVLTARFVHLIAEKKIPLRNILALTFTRKAAAEMYERIYLALAAQNSPWVREQREDFQNAHITTIDSFCTEILRNTARDFGYTPEFTVDAEACADLALLIAQRYIVRRRGDSGMKELLASFSPDEVARSFFKDLGITFISPIALYRPLFQPMEASLRSFTEAKTKESLHIIRSVSGEILRLSDDIPEPKKDCMAAIEAAAAFLAALEGPSRLDSPLSLSFGAPAAPAEFDAEIQAFSNLALRAYARSEAETAIKIRAKKAREAADRLIALADYAKIFPSHSALLERLDEYARELAEAKRKANILDFKDLGLCAVESLQRRKDIRSFWKQRIDSIMIDEFQDNNQIQKDLLYLLAERKDKASDGIPSPDELEEGKLFFVGDEKQSIYRFRGADVSVFKRLAEDLSQTESPEPDHASPRGQPHDQRKLWLPNNYRSSLSLLSFFNQFFATVLDGGRGEGDCGESAYGESGVAEFDGGSFEADYRAMAGGSNSPALKSFASSIRYFLLESNGETEDEEPEIDQGIESDDDRLAFEIAAFIRSSTGVLKVRAGSEAAGQTRPSEFDDFAVLLRTKTQQHRLEKNLRMLGIPYEAENPRGLFAESPANDIHSILRYAIDPTDKTAYAAVLRSPLVRVSDEAFLELLTGGGNTIPGGAPPLPGVDTPLPDAGTPLPDRDRALLGRMEAFFEELRSLLGILPVADLVDFIWHKAGLRLDILSRPKAHSFLEHFDYIFHLAASIDREGKALSAFLDILGSAIGGSGETSELEHVPRRLAGGVRILTIHKAKGLEFPIVIIPWIESSGRIGRSQKLWQMLPQGLTVDIKPFDSPGTSAKNILYDLGKQREEAMEKAEIKRLLYVACTRAEDHLFFFGKNRKLTDQKGRSFKYYLDAFSGLSGESIDNAGKPADHVPSETSGAAREASAQRLKSFNQAYGERKALKRRYPRYRLSVTEINAAAREAVPLEDSEPGTGAQPRSLPPKAFGSLCHDMTDYAIRHAGVQGYAPPENLIRDFGAELLPQAMLRARSLVEAFLTSEFWRETSASAIRVRTEAAFLYALDRFFIEGRMDLLIEDRQELIVLDFKTDEELDPQDYGVQLEIYRRAAESLAGGKRAKACLYWLKTGQIFWQDSAVSDDALAAFAEKTALGKPGRERAAGDLLE
jgi:ATP-dependent helicase/nuclease subunit A